MNKAVRHLAGQRLMLGFDGTQFNSDLETSINRSRLAASFFSGGTSFLRIRWPGCAPMPRHVPHPADSRPCSLPWIRKAGWCPGCRPRLPSLAATPHIQTREQAIAFARVTARELQDVGINMNLAPVLDVVSGHSDSIMKTRAFPGDARTVTDLGISVIQTLQSCGVMAVAKHFPGIGRTVLDSHHLLPVLDVDLTDLQAADLIPFEAAVRADTTGIMVSHIFCPRLDPHWQASLSVTIARDLIRQNLGFNGLVLTDDLDMKAIHHDMDTCMDRILASDIDLALICHPGPNIEKAFDALVRRLEADQEAWDRGEASQERINRYKGRYLGWNRTAGSVSGG